MNESETTSKPEMTDTDASAESILERMPLAEQVPHEARQEIHAILRQPPRTRPPIIQIWKDLRMKERFNVGQHMFRDYARMFQSIDADASSWRLAQDLAELRPIPARWRQEMQQTNEYLLQSEFTRLLRSGQLNPSELTDLLTAMARHVTAQARLITQQLAQHKYRQQEQQAQATLAQQASQKDPFTDPEELRRRVRLIYGWDMPDDYGHENDPPPSGPNSLTDPSQASARLKRTLEAVGICGDPRPDPNPPSDATQGAGAHAAITPPPESPESAVVPESPRPDVSASPAVPCNLSPVTCNLPFPAVPCNLPFPTPGARAGASAGPDPLAASQAGTLSAAPRHSFDRPPTDPGPVRQHRWQVVRGRTRWQ